MRTVLDRDALNALRPRFRGQLLGPETDGFEVARRVWNGMIDKTPSLIARCTGPSDVRSAVEFARKQGIAVAVRGGGHNAAGNAVCDDGIVIDLSSMKGIRVDPANQRVRSEAGVVWGEFDRETQAFGLATTGGAVSTTGIAGLTLGGGVGWLMGKCGLTCDNLVSADLVMADGRFLTASGYENQDLFWALRGGGGNFGVVTSFEYRLHRIGTVLGGFVLHPITRSRDVLHFYRDFTAEAPDELTAYAVFMTSPHGEPVVGIALCYCGEILEEGERIVAPVRNFGPPVLDVLRPLPYVEQQSMLDEAAPHGLQTYWKANQLQELSDEAIDAIVEHAAQRSSPRTIVLIEHHHGKLRRVAPDATAFRHREAPYDLVIMSLWEDPEENERHVSWTRTFFEAIQPFFGSGVYVNTLSHDEGNDRVRAAYGANYDRLAALKQKFDPDNFFRMNQNIQPHREPIA